MAKRFDPTTDCLHLRCKEMFYDNPTPEEVELEEEVKSFYGDCSSTVYWCECTQTGRGPDDEPVNRKECHSSRRCFVNVDSLT